jgi:hypothetical protein
LFVSQALLFVLVGDKSSDGQGLFALVQEFGGRWVVYVGGFIGQPTAGGERDGFGRESDIPGKTKTATTDTTQVANPSIMKSLARR